ncbi:MAG: CDP-diacylglycerol--glycerol-3-phosphate 3-phosphatidyltransferase [Myxococcota bacterium]|jgi:CDP-diacylglycerol--glycerol-3-phosphate 3-phosphatidyltransferase
MGNAPGVGTRTTQLAGAFPREEFWNLPNTISTFRLAMVPVLMALPFATGRSGSQLLAWLYIVAALSDILDGWLARRGQQVTRIGKLLDPLADKLLVSTALIMLIAVDRLDGYAWMAVVIVGRELAVTGLRGIASAGGRVMPASWLGKAKALSQNSAIVALLFYYPQMGLPGREIGLVLLALATVLTLWSGYFYFADYFGSSLEGADEAEGT